MTGVQKAGYAEKARFVFAMFRKKKVAPRRTRNKGKARFFLLLVFAVVALFFINGIAKGINFGNFIFQPISKAPSIFGQKVSGGSFWDGKTKVNIAVASDPVLVISISQLEKSAKILAIPKDTYCQVPGGYGWYRLGATYGLGALENPSRGGQLFAKTVSSMISVPIDYYLVDKDNPFFPVDSTKVEKYKDDFLGLGGIIGLTKNAKWIKNNLDTNFTLLDMYRAWWQVKGYGFAKDDYLDLSGDYLEEIVLPDSTRGFVPREDRFAILAEEIFSDPVIGQENLMIEIENGTETAGLGEAVEGMLENIGAKVVRVETAGQLQPQSKILVSKDADVNAYTVSRLSKVLGLKVEKEKNAGDFDLKLVLGKDWSF